MQRKVQQLISLAKARLEFARADLRTDLTAVEQIQAQMAVLVGYRVELLVARSR